MADSFESTKRRDALRTLGLASLSLFALGAGRGAQAAESADSSFNSIRGGATKLRELGARLAAIERRRGFDEVPFMLTDSRYWDRDAINEVLAYRYRSRQLWENSDLGGPWPGLMREALNGQVFTLGNVDFLEVSATHGLAHLALFSQAMWDKYNLASIAGPKFTSNTLIVEKAGVTPGDKLEDVEGFYGPNNNNIVSLQRRGAVFLGCHDSIHAIARQVHANSPDAGSADKIAADLTNNLIPGVVLVPSVVAWLVELQRAGFTYSKGG
jgi:hypothetical protein